MAVKGLTHEDSNTKLSVYSVRRKNVEIRFKLTVDSEIKKAYLLIGSKLMVHIKIKKELFVCLTYANSKPQLKKWLFVCSKLMINQS